MAQFNTYTNMLDTEVATTDELGIWDTSAVEFKNITLAEFIDYVNSAAQVIPDGTDEGQTVVWDDTGSEWDVSSVIGVVPGLVVSTDREPWLSSNQDSGTAGLRITNLLSGAVPVYSAEDGAGNLSPCQFAGTKITFSASEGTYGYGVVPSATAPSATVKITTETDVAANGNVIVFGRGRYNALTPFVIGPLVDGDVIAELQFTGADGAFATGANAELYGTIKGVYKTGDLLELTLDADDVIITGDLTSSQTLVFDSTAYASNQDVFAGNRYMFNTTAASRTATFDASPTIGDMVGIMDNAGTFQTNKMILNPNGLKFYGTTGNMDIEDENFSGVFIYTGSTEGWKLI
jgi:hypothetical protein